VELAAFTGKPDLSCYYQGQALALHRDIQRSETLSGTIAPRFETRGDLRVRRARRPRRAGSIRRPSAPTSKSEAGHESEMRDAIDGEPRC
jgi:hypothetical protein